MRARATLGAGAASSTAFGTATCLFVLAAGLQCGLAQTPQLVSVRDPAAAMPADFQNSVAPVVSADGRYVLFISSANNLVPGDNNQLGTDLFLRDRAMLTTTLISTNISGTGGGNGSAGPGVMSDDGRYVLFESYASNLVAGDTNTGADIFLHDRQTGNMTLVSVSTNGTSGSSNCWDAVMTPDGRYVAFVSSATNLVANDTNGIPDVFVRDLLTGTTTLVSVGATGPVGSYDVNVAKPAITPNGRYVAWFSMVQGLVPGIVQYPGDIYLRDLQLSQTIWVSSNLSATITPLNAASTHPVISDDGRYVSFKYGYTNGVGPGPLKVTLFRYDALAASNTVIATNGFPTWPGYDDIYGPEMTPDGRFVVYVARTNLSYTNNSTVWIWDAQSGSNAQLSLDQTGDFPTNRQADTPVVSPDGRFVGFLCNATNMVSNLVSVGFHVYVRDLQTGVNQLIDVGSGNTAWADVAATIPSMSPDGRFVAFASPDNLLVTGDTNRGYDAFLRDTAGGITELVSQRDVGVVSQSGGAPSSSAPVSMSADGRWLAFASYAEDLVTNDFNWDQDVFVRDLVGGGNLLVSVGTNGLAGMGGWSSSPVISANGQYVTFASVATNLAPYSGASTLLGLFASKIFQRDLLTGTTIAVSASTNGASLQTSNCFAPATSQDGRYVAFLMKVNTGSNSTYWHDVLTGQEVLLNGGASASTPPSISSDGRYVAYQTSRLTVWDSAGQTNVFTNGSAVTSAAISPNGSRVLFQVTIAATNRVFVTDIITRSNLFAFDSRVGIRSQSQWSADGRYFVFVTAANPSPGDNNGTNDVFLCDLETGTMTLVSMNASHTGSANGPSDLPVISGNGRFVVFRSFASNIAPGFTSAPNLLVFDRFTGLNTLLGNDPPGSANWSSWVSRPAISSNGLMVAFQTLRALPDAASDLNRVPDLFSLVQLPVLDTDSDLDGVPDAWTEQYFGHPLGQESDLSRANDDADTDGLTNLQESLVGTNPTDPASTLRLQISGLVSPSSVVLSWPTVPGKSFRVHYKNDLSDALWQEAGGNVSVLGTTGYFVIPANQPARYFRVLGVN